MISGSSVNAIEWNDSKLNLLDQRYLPNEVLYKHCKHLDDVIDAIKTMVVRGAPAIGICAAFGAMLSVEYQLDNLGEASHDDFCARVSADFDRLASARPTAVNLMWAVAEMRDVFVHNSEDKFIVEMLREKAESIFEQDIQNNIKMGELAADAMSERAMLEQAISADSDAKFSVLTHCNAGSLATGGYGTALGAVRSAWNRGLIDLVYADETRPWLQGARLTAWELAADNIPVCVNTDGAAAFLLANKNIKWIIVGADRITANGDVINKIGTYSLAILAKYHQVKLMVVAPSNTIDMTLSSGANVDIEMRDGSELTLINGHAITSENTSTINPVFDVTPAKLVDIIVTEKGVVELPDIVKMSNLFR